MELFWKDTVMKIKALPPDKRLKVIEGLTKMLAQQPKGHSEDLLDSLKHVSKSSCEKINDQNR